jgi:SAM-dependent methyltransferase
LLYADKDYSAECDLLEGLFERSPNPVANVLDVGCGTGGHALELARRGYRVTGIDRSPSMLQIARDKATAAGVEGVFKAGDLPDLDLVERFDAAILMFAVLSYVVTDDEIVRLLTSIGEHLNPGGVVIFDCWYGPAVLSQGPSERSKTVTSGDERWIRTAQGRIDASRNVCVVDYRLQKFRGEVLVSETTEQHEMRFFSEPLLRALFAAAGFELRWLKAFPDVQRSADETTWNVIGLAH